MSSFRLYRHPPQCREPQEGNTATEGRTLLLESSLMVGPVQLSQSHWSTGWHGKWGDHTYATLCMWCPAWTKWCFLVLLKALFVKYFKKSIPLWGYKDSDCLIPLLKDSKPREVELWFQSKSITIRLEPSLPYQTIISCKIESKEDINSKWKNIYEKMYYS